MDAEQARALLATLPCPEGTSLAFELIEHVDDGEVPLGCGNARVVATLHCTHPLCPPGRHHAGWAAEHVEHLHDGDDWLANLAGAALAYVQTVTTTVHRRLASRWN